MPGKYWKPEEEQLLRQLWESGVHDFKVLTQKIGRSEGAIKEKLRRTGLLVVVQKLQSHTTTSLELPKELPSVEEALKILAGALNAAAQPGLDKVEVQRLQVVATLARTYKDLLADYIDYRQIEQKLVELEAKYARLAKKAKKAKGNAAKSDIA